MNESPEERVNRLQASPVWPLIDQFCAAPFRLAPEFAVVLERVLKIKQVRIVPTTDPGGMVFESYPDGTINVGIRSLERLWAFCWIFAAMQLERERYGGGQEIHLPECLKKLLHWAHKSATDETIPWPPGGPTPDNGSTDLQMKLAVEFFLGVSAAILYHELVHILRHGQSAYRLIEDADGKNRAYNHSLELEADRIAYDYVFTEWNNYAPDPRVFTKRVVLFGHAFTFLIADASFAGRSPESHTHPSPFRRLAQFVNCLEKEFPSIKKEADAGLLWVANSVYAITASIWPHRVLAIEFETPQEVLSACEKAFVPGTL